MELERLKGQKKSEIAMIEIAYEILRETNEVHDFNSLLEKIQNYLDLSTEELESRMVNFYTQLNADGSFISLGDNRWGLRIWYPIDSIDEEIISTLDDDEIKAHHKSRKKNYLTALDDDVIDYSDDDPEDEEMLDDDYIDDDDDDDNEDGELKDYRDDLNELGDSDEDDDLDDGIAGNLTIIDDKDVDDDLDDEEA